MFRFRHVLGVPAVTSDPPDDPEDLGVRASDLGHAVHDILSWLDFAGGEEQELAACLTRIADPQVRAEAEPLIRRFLSSKWCAGLRRSESVLREVPFELVVCGKVLAGRIDVMYLGSDGWTVLDYKTGRAEDRDRYELQVGIYAHAIHRLTGEMPAKSALVLLSIDDEWVQDTSDGSLARAALSRIGEVVSAVDAGHFAPAPGGHCSWCSLSYLCPKE
jgi:RecB family exonuclease